MKSGAIVLLLLVSVLVQSSVGHRLSCRQRYERLLRQNSRLSVKNKHVSWELKSRSEKGPQNWDSLYPEQCAGSNQSPIHIDPKETQFDWRLKDLVIWYDPPSPNSTWIVENNINTYSVKVNTLGGKFYVSNGGLPNIYSTVQFHFHWGSRNSQGSEHAICGELSPIELHIVSYNSDLYESFGEAATQTDGLAVLGILFELVLMKAMFLELEGLNQFHGANLTINSDEDQDTFRKVTKLNKHDSQEVSHKDNPALDGVVKALRQVMDPNNGINIEVPALSMRALLPRCPEEYYRYRGSLTIPPCYESVIWTVFKNKQTISRRQLREFRKLLQPNGDRLVDNFRPIQPLNGRIVYRSFFK